MTREIECQLSTLSTLGVGKNKLDAYIESQGPLLNTVRAAREFGYDTIAIVPTHRVHCDILEGALIQDETIAVGSAGQTYRSERGIFAWSLLTHDNPVLAVQSILVFPHKDASLHSLSRLQKENAGQLPVAVQTIQDIKLAKKQGVKNPAVILSPEAFLELGARSGKEFGERVANIGGAVCLDPTYQLDRSTSNEKPSPFRNRQQVIRSVMPHVALINLSLGRDDFGDTDSGSVKALADLAYGTEDTDVRERIKTVRDAMNETGNTPPVVLQIPYTGVAQVLSRPVVNLSDLQEVHAPVLAEVRKLLRS